jgi:DNA polymerase III subunit gamma/tau
MSYLVLARKYRPKTFTEMVGQEHVVQALTNALTTQRLHHAYLFTGTRGVGKTTVSRILAKSLNCQGADGQGGITATPCGVCQACIDIDADRFIDYTELDAASNRGIDDVQSLLEQAAYKPVQGRFKVFMIDEVHMLTGPAFNSMLKTLEEPPPVHEVCFGNDRSTKSTGHRSFAVSAVQFAPYGARDRLDALGVCVAARIYQSRTAGLAINCPCRSRLYA